MQVGLFSRNQTRIFATFNNSSSFILKSKTFHEMYSIVSMTKKLFSKPKLFLFALYEWCPNRDTLARDNKRNISEFLLKKKEDILRVLT